MGDEFLCVFLEKIPAHGPLHPSIRLQLFVGLDCEKVTRFGSLSVIFLLLYFLLPFGLALLLAELGPLLPLISLLAKLEKDLGHGLKHLGDTPAQHPYRKPPILVTPASFLQICLQLHHLPSPRLQPNH